MIRRLQTTEAGLNCGVAAATLAVYGIIAIVLTRNFHSELAGWWAETSANAQEIWAQMNPPQLHGKMWDEIAEVLNDNR